MNLFEKMCLLDCYFAEMDIDSAADSAPLKYSRVCFDMSLELLICDSHVM